MFADTKLTNIVDVRELIEAKKNCGKVFDPIQWLPVDITNEGNAIEALEELEVAGKIEVRTQFKSMVDFRMTLSDMVISSHYDM